MGENGESFLIDIIHDDDEEVEVGEMMVGEVMVESQKEIVIDHRMEDVEDDEACGECRNSLEHRQRHSIVGGE